MYFFFIYIYVFNDKNCLTFISGTPDILAMNGRTELVCVLLDQLSAVVCKLLFVLQ